MTFRNNYEALVEALRLALIAPTDEQAQRAAELAEHLCVDMYEETIEQAKADALALASAGDD